jgi:hypothetical protein
MQKSIRLTNLILVAYAGVVIGCRHNDGLDPNEPATVLWADAGRSAPPTLPPTPDDESPIAAAEPAGQTELGSTNALLAANVAAESRGGERHAGSGGAGGRFIHGPSGGTGAVGSGGSVGLFR